MNFFKKFFGYFKNADGGVEPYKDGLGGDAFVDWRFYAWIILLVGIAVCGYCLFKKHKKAGRITIIVLCTLLFVTRLTNQTIRAIIGAENPWWRAFPFHMCTVLTFILPLTAIFKWDKIKPAVYPLGIMGGVITILVNDYFENAFMTFSTFEGMTAHSLLILVPIFSVAIGDYSIKWKDSWKTIVGILVLIVWAMSANLILIYGLGVDANYMYLMKNALPFSFGGYSYLAIYVAIFAVFLTIIYGAPDLYRRIKQKKLEKNSKT